MNNLFVQDDGLAYSFRDKELSAKHGRNAKHETPRWATKEEEKIDIRWGMIFTENINISNKSELVHDAGNLRRLR